MESTGRVMCMGTRVFTRFSVTTRGKQGLRDHRVRDGLGSPETGPTKGNRVACGITRVKVDLQKVMVGQSIVTSPCLGGLTSGDKAQIRGRHLHNKLDEPYESNQTSGSDRVTRVCGSFRGLRCIGPTQRGGVAFLGGSIRVKGPNIGTGCDESHADGEWSISKAGSRGDGGLPRDMLQILAKIIMGGFLKPSLLACEAKPEQVGGLLLRCLLHHVEVLGLQSGPTLVHSGYVDKAAMKGGLGWKKGTMHEPSRWNFNNKTVVVPSRVDRGSVTKGALFPYGNRGGDVNGNAPGSVHGSIDTDVWTMCLHGPDEGCVLGHRDHD
ncbi:hypothetical protein L1987_13200 [Smallanthus sonchifolius]|uniref:Uncharacterized protein n=1 Tax=Smallanthus sonchifolius TaxID=185202 RepID=A0ACB9JI15_9ASTR|nr:hypothetical protein L1987_13200 [Smallanthus sonchifolius]